MSRDDKGGTGVTARRKVEVSVVIIGLVILVAFFALVLFELTSAIG
jgi:hypothetical protein